MARIENFTEQEIIDNLILAYAYASLHSQDLDTQNAAILDDKNEQVLGFNHFRCETPKEEWLKKPEKLLWIEHAERDAIYTAAKYGIKTQYCVMFCPWASCVECARAIIFSGIQDLVVHYHPLNPTRFGKPISQFWKPQIEKAFELFDYHKIRVHVIDKQLTTDLTIKFSGETVIV